VLIGALWAAGPASAATSRGFTIENLSPHILKLTGVTAVYPANSKQPLPFGFDGRPGNGSLLRPGHSQRFELLYEFNKQHFANIVYEVEGTQRKAAISLWIESALTGSSSRCEATSDLLCHAGRQDIQVLAPKGGEQIHVKEHAQQMKILRELCFEGSPAECEQGSVYRFETETPSRIDGNMWVNCSTERRLVGIDRTADVPVTLNGEAPLKRLSDQMSDVTQEAWGLKLSPWKVRKSLTLDVPPGEMSGVRLTAPLWGSGTAYHVKLGNTRWYVPVTWLWPDQRSDRGIWKQIDTEMSPAAKAICENARSKRSVSLLQEVPNSSGG
jgi:hypothetical protein